VRRSGLAATKVMSYSTRRSSPPGDSRTSSGSSTAHPSPCCQAEEPEHLQRLAEVEARSTAPLRIRSTSMRSGLLTPWWTLSARSSGLSILGSPDHRFSVNVGAGTVHTAHGNCRYPRLPLPAAHRHPALLIVHHLELTTPTGAAIISTLASSFGPCPHEDRPHRLRAGTRPPGQPNVLRLMIGELATPYEETHPSSSRQHRRHESQLYDHLIELLMQRRA